MNKTNKMIVPHIPVGWMHKGIKLDSIQESEKKGEA